MDARLDSRPCDRGKRDKVKVSDFTGLSLHNALLTSYMAIKLNKKFIVQVVLWGYTGAGSFEIWGYAIRLANV